MDMSYPMLTELEWDEVDKIWDLLEEGALDRARVQVDELLARRPSHPDLEVVDAAVALEEGTPERALRCLDGAERSADPALFFHLRALAHYMLVHLEPARSDAEQALAIHPDLAESHDLLSRVLEMLGEPDAASEHADAAYELDPEGFPASLEIEDQEFDTLVEQSLLELPPKVREHLEQIPVLVERLPDRDILAAEDPPLSPDILGLFVGRHLLERQHDDLPAAPGAIYLFRQNLLRVCADRAELAREIRITVQHEVGHLLGLDEDELEEWGLA